MWVKPEALTTVTDHSFSLFLSLEHDDVWGRFILTGIVSSTGRWCVMLDAADAATRLAHEPTFPLVGDGFTLESAMMHTHARYGDQFFSTFPD